MPTAKTRAGTQKWLSVSTARRFDVFKKRSLAPMWGVTAPRLYNCGWRLQSEKGRPGATHTPSYHRLLLISVRSRWRVP